MLTDLNKEREQAFIAGLTTALVDGSISYPYVLLKYYHLLDISDAEAMLIMHMIAFREREDKAFPTIEELQSRMASDADEVVKMLQRLMKLKLIDIEESFDPASGLHVERYTLNPLYMNLAHIVGKKESGADWELPEPSVAKLSSKPLATGNDEMNLASPAPTPAPATEEGNLFSIFEQEFGRPLSPMEVDMINGWLDQDQYPEALILAALKEAVFSGKKIFRYVDRILLDWHRNQVHTVEQAREYSQKFRGLR